MQAAACERETGAGCSLRARDQCRRRLLCITVIADESVSEKGEHGFLHKGNLLIFFHSIRPQIARTGGHWLANLSRARPAQEQSSKQRSGGIACKSGMHEILGKSPLRRQWRSRRSASRTKLVGKTLLYPSCARTKLKTVVRRNPNAFERCTKIRANHIFGDGRQSKARSGRSLLETLSCTNPAQDQSSKQRSGGIARTPRTFGPIAGSPTITYHDREPEHACCQNSLVLILRKNKARNSGPGESHASERSTKVYAYHLFGDDRKSRAGAGGCLMANFSCANPAQEKSSKQRSGGIASRIANEGRKSGGQPCNATHANPSSSSK